MGRFPVTLYREQWEKLLSMADDVRTPRHEKPQTLLLHHNEPGSDDRALWAAPTLRLWLRASGWRRSRTAFGLEEVHVVRLWIDCDRFGAGECVNRRNYGVLVR